MAALGQIPSYTTPHDQPMTFLDALVANLPILLTGVACAAIGYTYASRR